jgi:hypothetical protein
MLFEEIFFVYFEHHTKPVNALSDQNAEFLNVKAGGIFVMVTVNNPVNM